MQFVKCEVLVCYQGITFSSKELGDSFLKGGAAREASFQYLGKEVGVVRPRDLDFWVGPNPNPFVRGWVRGGEDWKPHYGAGAREIMGREEVDVNLNEALITADGLWMGWGLIEGWLRKEVWSVGEVKKEKRCVRAHFFGFRYGFKTREPLPVDHPYLITTLWKAQGLGMLEGWKAYLEERGVKVGVWWRYAVEEEVELGELGNGEVVEEFLETLSGVWGKEDWEVWALGDWEAGRVSWEDIGVLNKHTKERRVIPEIPEFH